MANESTNPGEMSDRERRICENVPLVRYVIRHMELDRIPSGLEFEDLVGHGIVGLVQASDRFDDALGIAFQSYAIPRIRGAVIDALRLLDPLTRTQRAKAKRINDAHGRLIAALGREPTDLEVCEAAGMTREEYTTIQKLSTYTCVRVGGWHTDDGDSPADFELPDPGEPPSAGIEREQLIAALGDAIAKLPERERLIVALFYKEQLTHREISGMLGISESRVSQLIHQALGRLRRNPLLAEAIVWRAA